MAGVGYENGPPLLCVPLAASWVYLSVNVRSPLACMLITACGEASHSKELPNASECRRAKERPMRRGCHPYAAWAWKGSGAHTATPTHRRGTGREAHQHIFPQLLLGFGGRQLNLVEACVGLSRGRQGNGKRQAWIGGVGGPHVDREGARCSREHGTAGLRVLGVATRARCNLESADLACRVWRGGGMARR